MKRILIIEDDMTLVKLYTTSLTGVGYQVDQSFDGADGYSKISKGGYDLILLDLRLPILSGIDILRKLKEMAPNKPNGPVLVLTNLKDDETIAEAVSLGAKDYILKTDFTPKQILEKVQKNFVENP